MTAIRRGTVLTFDSATWTAAILLDGSDAETIMPVGEWVAAGLMDVADEVAVLMFGKTDSDDGLVLGPYGSVSTYSYPELSGLAVGSVLRATSTTAAAFGAVDLADTDAVTGTLPVSNLGTTQVPTFGAINVGAATSAGTGAIFLQANAANQLVLRLNDTSGNERVAFQYLVAGEYQLAIRDGAGTQRIILAPVTPEIDLAKSTGIYKVNGTQVVASRKTGYTNAWVTTAAERAAARDAATITLVQLAQRVRALQDDFTTHGLIGV